MPEMTREQYRALYAQRTREYGYVSEYNRLCSRLVNITNELLKLMGENKQKDEEFTLLIADVLGRASGKVATGDKWLLAMRDTLTKMELALGEDKNV